MGQTSGLTGTNATMSGQPAGLGAEGTHLGVLAAASLAVGNTLRMNEDRSDLAAHARPMVASPGHGRLRGRWQAAHLYLRREYSAY